MLKGPTAFCITSVKKYYVEEHVQVKEQAQGHSNKSIEDTKDRQLVVEQRRNPTRERQLPRRY